MAPTVSGVEDSQVFAAIADERRELANLLDSFTESQWTAASLCRGWQVRDVAAHLVMPLITAKPTFVMAMVKARGDFDKANIALTASTVRRRGDNLPNLLREHADSRFTPPVLGPRAPLTDVMIHGQDIRRPLGVTRSFRPERQRAVLDLLTTRVARHAFGHLPTGIRWQATDLDWSHGEGPVIEGPAEAIMLTLTGRRAALGDLSGEGAEQLR